MLGRLRRMSRGGWIAVGICTGAVIAPGIAVAAFSDFRIVGTNGSPVAQVTKGSQLRVAEIDASRFQGIDFFNLGGGNCITKPVPSPTAYIVKQAVVNVIVNPSPGSGQNVALFANSNCGIGQVIGD